MTSPFNWRAKPPQINLGRVKSDKQTQKDAARVNPYSVTARNLGPLKSKTSPR